VSCGNIIIKKIKETTPFLQTLLSTIFGNFSRAVIVNVKLLVKKNKTRIYEYGFLK
jgi:hypothetical protein